MHREEIHMINDIIQDENWYDKNYNSLQITEHNLYPQAMTQKELSQLMMKLV